MKYVGTLLLLLLALTCSAGNNLHWTVFNAGNVPFGGTFSCQLGYGFPSSGVNVSGTGALATNATFSVVLPATTGGLTAARTLTTYYTDSSTPSLSPPFKFTGTINWSPTGGEQYYTVTVYPNGTNGSAPLIYTNIVGRMTNTTSSDGYVQWFWDGVIAMTAFIPIGGGSVYTSPNVEVSPVADNYSLQGTFTSNGTTLGVNSDGSLGFIPISYTAGSSGTVGTPVTTGTGSGTPPVQNNPYDFGGGSTPPLTVLTTNSSVVWSQPATGAALDSTLKMFGNQNHVDLQALQSGQSILNTSLGKIAANQSTYGIASTNLLGQAITLLASNAYVDGMWLPRIYGAITNQAGPSNAFSVSFTNFTTITNSSQLTNYTLESTLEGVSNLLSEINSNLFSYDTNTDFGYSDTNVPDQIAYPINPQDTNSDAATAVATGLIGSGLLATIWNGTNTLAGFLNQTIPDGTMPSFVITIPLAHVTMDLNPVTAFPWFFLFLHALVTWLTLLAFASGVIKIIWDALKAYAAGQTTPPVNMTGGGTTQGTKIQS